MSKAKINNYFSEIQSLLPKKEILEEFGNNVINEQVGDLTFNFPTYGSWSNYGYNLIYYCNNGAFTQGPTPATACEGTQTLGCNLALRPGWTPIEADQGVGPGYCFPPIGGWHAGVKFNPSAEYTVKLNLELDYYQIPLLVQKWIKSDGYVIYL